MRLSPAIIDARIAWRVAILREDAARLLAGKGNPYLANNGRSGAAWAFEDVPAAPEIAKARNHTPGKLLQ
jgi:hypothetical protein